MSVNRPELAHHYYLVSVICNSCHCSKATRRLSPRHISSHCWHSLECWPGPWVWCTQQQQVGPGDIPNSVALLRYLCSTCLIFKKGTEYYKWINLKFFLLNHSSPLFSCSSYPLEAANISVLGASSSCMFWYLYHTWYIYRQYIGCVLCFLININCIICTYFSEISFHTFYFWDLSMWMHIELDNAVPLWHNRNSTI